MQIQGHGAYQTSWGHGTYLYGLQTYAVNTLGYDITYSWGSAYASSKVFLGSGDDQVFGNIGSDKVHTGAGDDLIRGGAGDDTLHAGTGTNSIYYGTKVFPRSGIGENYYGDGDDILFGGDGDDKLIDKGVGNNIFVGGKGDDTFYIGDLASDLKLADIIKDYGKGDDSLSFVTGTHTVYVKKSGKDTILQDGRGDDAEIYAILQGYTDPLTDEDSNGVTFVEIV